MFPPVFTITCLRTFAAWGITATAGNDCPGADRKSLPASGQKVLRDVHFTPGLAETVVAVYAPGDRGLNW
ncbi:putative protein [Escherichia coli ISC7]|uniref:Uncharacterized protein n=1 Tax=Escherichia coli ISC7 TaxID=1432555 RepID=W1FA14_ECOLX|nr:putative protein [Escherichia coli ISC7]